MTPPRISRSLARWLRLPALVRLASILAAGGLLCGLLCVANAYSRSQPEGDSWRFADVRGGDYRLPAPADCQALVLIFLGHDCPISNSYAPELNRIRQEFAGQGVATCLVYADAQITREQGCRHAVEYGLESPAVLDPEMVLAKWVGATVKPEAAVLSPQRELLYLGRIDDRYADFGRPRPSPRQTDLRAAILAALEGRKISVPRTRAVGCDIERRESRAQ